MRVSRGARFWSTLPSDYVEEDNDIKQFGGRTVIAAIRDLLAERGYDVDELIDEGEQGWQLPLDKGAQRFLVQITYVDCYYLLIDEITPSCRKFWTGRYGRRKNGEDAIYAAFVADLAAALADDPRFDRIEWFEDPGDAWDLDRQGEPAPLIET